MNRKTIAVITLFLFVGVFSACEKQDMSSAEILKEKSLVNNSYYQNIDEEENPCYIKFRFHRRRFGCNSRFGICLVRLHDEESLELNLAFTTLNLKKNTMDIYFMDKISWAEPNFFGSDEDPFIFPEEVLKEMKISHLEIIPNDYKYESMVTKFIDETGKEKSCYGHVKVDVIVEK